MKYAACIRALLLGSLLGLSVGWAWAAEKVEQDAYAYRAGIRNSPTKYRLNDKQLKFVLAQLQQKTGFTTLRFDAAGFLTLDDPTQFVGGSATARALVLTALQGPTQLVLENHSYSAQVAFASISENLVYLNMSTKARCEHRSIQIDFPDFNKLMGEKEVRASFDLGIVLLHELVHGALNLKDDVGEWEELGECERHTNTIRKELGLPERQQYIARSRSVQSPQGWTVQWAELQFARTDYKNGTLKSEEYKLTWDAKQVGLGQRTDSLPATVAAKSSERKSTAAIQ